MNFAALALAEALALGTKVVTQHRAEYEVLLGRQFIERTRHDEADGVETFLTAEIEIEVVLARRLQHILDVLALQTLCGILFIFLRTGEKNHLANTFLVFVDVVHQHFHL